MISRPSTHAPYGHDESLRDSSISRGFTTTPLSWSPGSACLMVALVEVEDDAAEFWRLTSSVFATGGNEADGGDPSRVSSSA